MPLNMTAQWVERVKPTDKRAEYFDDDVPGLLLRVSPAGKKTWYLFFRLKGDTARRRDRLGEFPTLTLGEARKKAQQLILDASNGIDHGETKRRNQEGINFEEMAAEYIERYAKIKKRSWLKDQQRIAHLLPRWGHLKAKDIKRRDVIDLLEEIAERGAPIEANRTLALIRKIFNWAIGRDLVENTPCAQVQAVASENQRDRVLNEDEIGTLWAAFEKLTTPMEAIFKLRLLTAQRGGEVEAMRWQDIDPSGEWWTIPAEVAKNGLSHRVPLSPSARSILQKLRVESKGSPWVFPSPGIEGHVTNINKAVLKLRELTGIEFVAHDLRRTAASWMASIGISRLTISKILNHSEGGVTRIYDRYSYDAEKAQALNAWADKLIDMLV